MTRTAEVAGRGKERGGSGGGAPFIKWGDGYAWIEGRVTGSFDTKYGLAVTLDVQNVHDGGVSAQGKTEDGEFYTVAVEVGGSYSLGTGSASLEGKITAEDKGKLLHVAHEGWEHPPNKNRYRVFRVIELEDRDASSEPYEHGPSEEPVPF